MTDDNDSAYVEVHAAPVGESVPRVDAVDDDTTPPPAEPVIKNSANRELCTILANLVVEAKQHHIALQSIYELVRDYAGVAPKLWGHKIIDEHEKYAERLQGHMTGLRSVVG